MENNGFRSFASVTPTPTLRPATTNPDPSLTVRRTDVPAMGYSVDLLNWINQAFKEGQAMLREESLGEDIDENIQMVMGQYHEMAHERNKPPYLSRHCENRLGKNINDIAAAITDFRPSWHYRTYNPAYEHQGKILDKLSVAWWYNNCIDLKLQLLVKQSLVARTAYAYVVYNPSLHNGLGDIDISILDYRDVIPIRPNSKISIQDAMGVIVHRRNTVNWAKARYGDKAASITPTTDGSFLKAGGRMKGITSALDYLEAQRVKRDDFAIPLYDHYEIYLKDSSVNATQEKVWIGPGPTDKHPWGYWVEPGKPLYPYGRLIIVANMLTVLYDGGNPYWHGMFPVAKLTLDPWGHSLLGKSVVADAKGPQLIINELVQGVMNSCRKALNPGIMADKNAVPREVLNRFDSREPGFKLKTNPSVGQGVVLETPPILPDYVMTLLERETNALDYVTGVLDMRALEQVRSLNGNTDAETMLEYLGPSIKTKGRILEVFIREIGEMMKSNFFQFYNIGRRVQILGKDGMDFEDFDYDPGSLVPSEEPLALGPQEASRFYNTSQDEFGQPSYSRKPRGERAREHCKSFVFFLTPGSLLNMSKRQDQLMHLQLFTAGVIDPVTLLEKLEIQNIGELPGAPTTIIERMQAAGAAGFTGAVSSAGRKAGYDQMPQMRPDGKMSTSG